MAGDSGREQGKESVSTEKAKRKSSAKKKEPHPHDGHRLRMKERFLKEGLETFQEHEALEMLLYYVQPRGDTNARAHKILKVYGSLSNLFEADVEDIKRTLGTTEHTAILFKLVPSMSKKYMLSKWKSRPSLDNLHSAGSYCVSLYQGALYEKFTVLCLDAAKRLISSEVIAEGTIDEAHVYPRKVVEAAVRFQANSVILVHNHPSGTMQPSFSDIEITKRIDGILRTIGIALADHIIVCGDEYYSFAKNMLLVEEMDYED